MLCEKCGEDLQEDAKACPKCNTPTSGSENTADLSSAPEPSGNEKNEIWNPVAASNWCLVFTPAFSSYIHAMNWRTLGEERRAKSAMGWFYVSLAMLIVYIFMYVFIADEGIADGSRMLLGLLYLIIWYFSAGRPQAKYVKEKFGKDYPRRGWGKPLLIGVAAIVGYYFVAAVIGLILGIIMTLT